MSFLPGPVLPPPTPGERDRQRRILMWAFAGLVVVAVFGTALLVVSFASGSGSSVPAGRPGSSKPVVAPGSVKSAAKPSAAPSASSSYSFLPGGVPQTPAPKKCAGLAVSSDLEAVSQLDCWLPVELRWRDLMPHGLHGPIDRAALDDRLKSVLQFNRGQNIDHPVRVLAVLGYAPPEANPGHGCDVYDCGPSAAHTGDYGRFVGKLASRLKVLLGVNGFAIEGWYEPNDLGHFGFVPLFPRTYAKMMISAHDAIQAVDPRIKFILGGLATQTSSEMVPPDSFVQSVITNAGGVFWDSVGMNVGSGGWQQLYQVHKVMAANGEVGPVDITEADVSPAANPDYARALLRFWRHTPWLGMVLVKASGSEQQLLQLVHTTGGSGQ